MTSELKVTIFELFVNQNKKRMPSAGGCCCMGAGTIDVNNNSIYIDSNSLFSHTIVFSDYDSLDSSSKKRLLTFVALINVSNFVEASTFVKNNKETQIPKYKLTKSNTNGEIRDDVKSLVDDGIISFKPNTYFQQPRCHCEMASVVFHNGNFYEVGYKEEIDLQSLEIKKLYEVIELGPPAEEYPCRDRSLKYV